MSSPWSSPTPHVVHRRYDENKVEAQSRKRKGWEQGLSEARRRPRVRPARVIDVGWLRRAPARLEEWRRLGVCDGLGGG